jgi:hypothetical protein
MNKEDRQTTKKIHYRKNGEDLNYKTKIENGNIAIETNKIQVIIQEYFKNLYYSKLENEE